MGIAQQRKQKFFTDNPVCCYCAGLRPATTQDHWPPRSFFVGRVWPEGYVFPACEKCNRISRIHENLFALVCRIRFDSASARVSEGHATREWESIAAGVARTLPDVYKSMLMPVSEKRARMRRLGINRLPGQTTADVPILSISHPEFGEAAKTVARKLFSSLYYMHAGRVLSANGRIALFWRTNATSLQSFFDETHVRPMLSLFPELRRGQSLLHDQFSYAYSVISADPPSAVFGVMFNHAVAMIGMVFGNIDSFPKIKSSEHAVETLLAPYR